MKIMQRNTIYDVRVWEKQATLHRPSLWHFFRRTLFVTFSHPKLLHGYLLFFLFSSAIFIPFIYQLDRRTGMSVA